MKCVVPIITPSMRLSAPPASFSTPVAPRLLSESRMPVVTSSLVGAFTAPRHLAVLDQDGVGVGAADVDADASHASKTRS